MAMKISIIIPSYNQVAYIGRALQSVVDQQDTDVELIVMDGGSSDGSIEVIKKYEPFISYWQSQRDGGQSAAINAGLRRAVGRFKVWLNSDDILLPGALANLRAMSARYPDCRWFAGSVLWIDKEDRIIRVGKQETPGRIFRSKRPVQASPSSFLRDDLWDEFGLLREDMHYMMDTELWCRLINGGEMPRRIPGYTWALRLHEAAKMSGHNFKGSPLADPNHPSFVQKQKEIAILKPITPGCGRLSSAMFFLNKIFDHSFLSRVWDRRMLGHKISEMFK